MPISWDPPKLLLLIARVQDFAHDADPCEARPVGGDGWRPRVHVFLRINRGDRGAWWDAQAFKLFRDLPPVITVDVSGLKEIDDEIRVKDLKVPPGCEFLDEPEDLIVKVAAHREEVEEVAAAPAAAEVPTVGETEAPADGAEGEAPAES